MSGIQVGQLYRKRTVRRMNGSIIDMTDEANGGAIIVKGRVVNPERFEEEQKKEKDREVAAQAPTVVVESHSAIDRTASPSKMEAMEKKIAETDDKLNQILELLKKK